ncbi:MAG: hypothetical protein QOG89_3599 [Thermomicrobiales bacterium]|nr:hypothetical protein [Thermomicrobiales bacterium]
MGRLDLSLWPSDPPRNQLADLETIRRSLTDETRLAILWIKELWHRLPVYPYEVGGVEVYDAVLAHGVRTPDELDGVSARAGAAGVRGTRLPAQSALRR